MHGQQPNGSVCRIPALSAYTAASSFCSADGDRMSKGPRSEWSLWACARDFAFSTAVFSTFRRLLLLHVQVLFGQFSG
jgi:hypothetical protein